MNILDVLQLRKEKQMTSNYFNKYLKRVANEEDLVLFQDVITSANLKMYRSAYILVWLSCVESLKRRFKDCGKQGDKKALDIYSQIKAREKKHQAVDISVLERAKNYGFIDDYEHARLLQLYQNRSVFAHPYETMPTKIDLEAAINNVIDFVLSKPTQLSEKYIDFLIEKLSNDANYLNDYDLTVKAEAKKWLSKIMPKCFRYFVEQYSFNAQTHSKSMTPDVFTRRAEWIITEILEYTKYAVYSDDEWHEFIVEHPEFSINLATNNKDFFIKIGERAQDYLIGKILEKSIYVPQCLNILSPYLEDKNFLRDNYNKIMSQIESLSLEALKSSGLEPKYFTSVFIKELESFDFYRQNSAVAAIEECEQYIKIFDLKKQFKLGYLIHSAARGNAWGAKDYINKIISNPNSFPLEFLKGVCSIIIEDSSSRNYISFRKEILQPINSIINNLDSNDEIVCYVNSLLCKYANYESTIQNYTKKEIKQHLNVDKCNWIKLTI